MAGLAECTIQEVTQSRHALGGEVHSDRPGFDLGKVKDIVDQGEKIVARGMDGLRIFDLLGGKITCRILRQHLRQDEQAVQRRPQFVRHVGQKFRFVPRAQR